MGLKGEEELHVLRVRTEGGQSQQHPAGQQTQNQPSFQQVGEQSPSRHFALQRGNMCRSRQAESPSRYSQSRHRLQGRVALQAHQLYTHGAGRQTFHQERTFHQLLLILQVARPASVFIIYNPNIIDIIYHYINLY